MQVAFFRYTAIEKKTKAKAGTRGSHIIPVCCISVALYALIVCYSLSV